MTAFARFLGAPWRVARLMAAPLNDKAKSSASMSDANSASLRIRGGGIALDLGKALRSKASVRTS
ncbi:hypothetical protein [Mesorhizobium sp. M1396]|uniref:hypothetical protein n=1 Tax=Mesorhizobium sp. M1396 TaxID=2957095 RepID=UPI003335B844